MRIGSGSLVAAFIATSLALAGCGAAHTGAAVGAAAVRPAKNGSGTQPLDTVIARAARDSAADQALLDSLHQLPPRSDSARAPTPPVAPRGEEVEREAVRLFGLDEGRAVVRTAEPTFDIDVTSFAANRRVLEYLEFFQIGRAHV